MPWTPAHASSHIGGRPAGYALGARPLGPPGSADLAGSPPPTRTRLLGSGEAVHGLAPLRRLGLLLVGEVELDLIKGDQGTYMETMGDDGR